jgi:ATP-binding cassette, subfamily G (WHITE), member 2, PDR
MDDEKATEVGAGASEKTLERTYEGVEDSARLSAKVPSSSDSSNIIELIKTEHDVEETKRDEEVLDLARRLSTMSQQSIYEKNPFSDGKDSALDPQSQNFSPRAFARSLLNLQARDPEKWKQRTAGFAFKDLNVYGFGSATDYQKTVGNVIFEVLGLTKKLMGLAKSKKIDILQNLDGLVHDGEMLVVLGPPGRSAPRDPD